MAIQDFEDWSTRVYWDYYFTILQDTPESYDGAAKKSVIVNDTETGLNYSSADIDDHSARHEDGGADELDAAILSGALGSPGQFLKTDGKATSWATLPTTKEPPLIHVEDQKSAGTSGGTFEFGAWRTRDLNTVVTNEIDGASLSSNQLTLPAGDYDVVFGCGLAFRVKRHVIRLRDVTNGNTLKTGLSGFADDGYEVSNIGFLTGRFTLQAETSIELQHRCEVTKADNGFGVQNDWTTCIYAVLKISKII